jgi:hypothetical protein
MRLLQVLPGILAISALLVSCSPPVAQYRHYFEAMSIYPGSGPDPALVKAIKKSKKAYPDRDLVLYWMDLGMANNVVGSFADSERVFREAERMEHQLYTKSLSRIALSYQTNDLVLPFRGLPFERVMINLVNSFNYAGQGDWVGALVETRKIREKLLRYNRRYPKATLAGGNYSRSEGLAQELLSSHNIPSNINQLNHYTDDAFARFLSGVYQEAQVNAGGVDYQSAMISYRKALRVYRKNALLYNTPIPSFVVPALLRASDAAGRTHLVARLRKEYPSAMWTREREFEKKGHIIFVGYDGRIFHLSSDRIVLPLPILGTISMVSFNIPRADGGGTSISGHRLDVVDDRKQTVLSVDSQEAEDLNAIGKTNFQDHLKRIVLREAVRAILKTSEEVVAQREGERYGGILGYLGAMVIGDAANVASDIADTRSWRTLPAMFDYAEADVTPGSYWVVVSEYGGGGHVLKEHLTVAPGQYLLIRDVDAR